MNTADGTSLPPTDILDPVMPEDKSAELQCINMMSYDELNEMVKDFNMRSRNVMRPTDPVPYLTPDQVSRAMSTTFWCVRTCASYFKIVRCSVLLMYILCYYGFIRYHSDTRYSALCYSRVILMARCNNVIGTLHTVLMFAAYNMQVRKDRFNGTVTVLKYVTSRTIMREMEPYREVVYHNIT